MYSELTQIRISYGEIICVYGKAHMTVVLVVFRLEITKLSYIRNVMF